MGRLDAHAAFILSKAPYMMLPTRNTPARPAPASDPALIAMARSDDGWTSRARQVVDAAAVLAAAQARAAATVESLQRQSLEHQPLPRGLADVLRAALPTDAAAAATFAGAVRWPLAALRRLASGAYAIEEVQAAKVAVLARALGLTHDVFVALLRADVPGEALHEFVRAWHEDRADDALDE